MTTTAKKTAPKKSAPPAKPRRLEDIAEGRKGLFCIDPALISIEPGFNHRIQWGDIPALADDIEANGLDQPLMIRKVEGTETIYVVAGHRRHKAITTILIPQGRWTDPTTGKNRTVDCYAEPRHRSNIDRLFSQIAGNTGLPYNLLEKARVYQDILSDDPTIIPAELARRSSESKQAVSDALCLVNDGWNVLINAVESGTLAASTAIRIIRQAGDDPDGQQKLYSAALANAERAGRPDHVMPKDVPEPPTVDPLKGWKFVPVNPKNNFCKIGLSAQGGDILAAEAIKGKGLPAGQSLAIGWSRDKRNGHRIALSFQGVEEHHFRGIPIDRNSPLFLDLPETLDAYIRSEISEVWPHLESEAIDRLLALIAKAAPVFAPQGAADSDPASSSDSSPASWEIEDLGDEAEWNDVGVCTNPITTTLLSPKHGIKRLVLEIARSPEGHWHSGFTHQGNIKGSACHGGGAPVSLKGSRFPSEQAAWADAFGSARRSMTGDIPADHPIHEYLSASYLTLEKLLGDCFDFSTSNDSQEATASSSATPPKFTLYEISEAPSDPLADGTYHETSRLVFAPLPDGCQRLHLLSALTIDGEPCYGYRYNDVTRLPDPSEGSSYGTLPEEGFAAMLRLINAFASTEFPTIDEALYDALCRYFPESGLPEDPESLAFVAIPDAPAKELTGYEAIVAAPSTNRDGSGVGFGSGGYASVDDRLKTIEELMNKLAEDDKKKPNKDRVTTAEILLQVLRSEKTPATLKEHLLGK